jgi:hypothetical protein
VLNDPVNFVDPWGLKVYLCKAPVNGVSLVNHHWIKTDSLERGMWNDNDTHEWYDDVPFAAHVAVRDEEYHDNAECKAMPYADESKVNEQLQNYKPLGIWTPWNQCQSFSQSVLDNARPSDFYKYMDNHTTNPYFNPNTWIPGRGL